MGFNRLVDARFDALNPRTANREIPARRHEPCAKRRSSSSSRRSSSSSPRGASNPLCLALSPVALAIVFWYSLAKRYTTWTQLFLGLAMAVAPVGGWLAVGGRGGWEPWLLALAIGMWVGGLRRALCVPGPRLRSGARARVDSRALRRADALAISRAHAR